MGGISTEEQAINRSQYLDLVYSQIGTLYDIILNSPKPTINPTRPNAPEPHAIGTIGSVKSQSQTSTSRNKNAPASSPPTTAITENAKPNPTLEQIFEVNAVQSSQQSGGKKKANATKGKNKKATSQET